MSNMISDLFKTIINRSEGESGVTNSKQISFNVAELLCAFMAEFAAHETAREELGSQLEEAVKAIQPILVAIAKAHKGTGEDLTVNALKSSLEGCDHAELTTFLRKQNVMRTTATDVATPANKMDRIHAIYKVLTEALVSNSLLNADLKVQLGHVAELKSEGSLALKQPANLQADLAQALVVREQAQEAALRLRVTELEDALRKKQGVIDALQAQVKAQLDAPAITISEPPAAPAPTAAAIAPAQSNSDQGPRGFCPNGLLQIVGAALAVAGAYAALR